MRKLQSLLVETHSPPHPHPPWKKSTSFYLHDIMNLEIMKILKIMVLCLQGVNFAFVIYKQHVYDSMLYNWKFLTRSTKAHYFILLLGTEGMILKWNSLSNNKLKLYHILFWWHIVLFLLPFHLIFLVEQLPLEDWVI